MAILLGTYYNMRWSFIWFTWFCDLSQRHRHCHCHCLHYAVLNDKIDYNHSNNKKKIIIKKTHASQSDAIFQKETKQNTEYRIQRLIERYRNIRNCFSFCCCCCFDNFSFTNEWIEGILIESPSDIRFFFC